MASLARRSLALASVLGVVAGAVLAGLGAASCEEAGNGGAGGNGVGGAGGGCPGGGPAPLFTIHIEASHGSVPADTAVTVTWSAGLEPTFKLDDPSTWMTLEDGTNLVCRVAADAGPPLDLAELVCEAWTTGATLVMVTATGFVTHEETLLPKLVDGCDHPVPSEVTITLATDPDAGAP